jgi:hypothetical protein
MRVLALGSCRIHDPLMVSHRLGQVEYLNRRFKSREPIYLQDIHEMIQFFRLAMGEIPMPAEIGPFAFYKGLRFDKRMPGVLRDAERVVIEVCTDKHYHAMGYALSTNEVHRQLVEATGAAGQAWWLEVNRGNEPPNDLVQSVETALRGARKLTDAHRLMLREIRFSRLSSTDIAEGMSTLQALLDRPVLVVPHVAVRLADGGLLAERISHIEKTVEAARQAGLPVLDPRSFVERDGQQRALDKGGTDIHHYAKDYLPIAGREIAKALHTCTEIDRTASVLDRE